MDFDSFADHGKIAFDMSKKYDLSRNQKKTPVFRPGMNFGLGYQCML